MTLEIEIVDYNELENNLFELVEITKIEKGIHSNVVDLTIEDDETFVLSNGIISHNSANAPLLDASNPKIHGLFPLKGKPENCYAKKLTDVVSQEIMYISRILNLSITKPDYSNMRYDKIVIATDADCLVEGTKVVTESGIKNIEDINPFEKVKTHKGNLKSVSTVTKTKKSNTILIKTALGDIESSLNHKHFVKRDGEIIEVLAHEILKTDKFLKRK